ncbi:serine/threonine-protein phosphatase [Kitasatospora sp. NBC_00240]|uniref:SpoIIE family protein phosphatase n=1 Tax=Kitasatospora sp. NBC_00240 TaxID=2903567 RepID=UPI00224D69CB|nr:SpoIIE family protein phosphatase [Kitasatospora sp. NBC_00240]MCX5215331.1 serine/threonine-protein phosphatase [Kitasatospora sp. NBC_00240]
MRDGRAAGRRPGPAAPRGPDPVPTDGLTEARDPRGAFYPVLERAGTSLSEADPDRVLSLLRADVARHTRAPLADDSAFLLLHLAAAP